MPEDTDLLRRRIGFGFLAIALLQLVLGFTILKTLLGQGLLFVFYWLACIGFTILALLNALLDMFIVRSRARREENDLAKGVLGSRDSSSSGDPNKGTEQLGP
jgi:hypothetical protein